MTRKKKWGLLMISDHRWSCLVLYHETGSKQQCKWCPSQFTGHLTEFHQQILRTYWNSNVINMLNMLHLLSMVCFFLCICVCSMCSSRWPHKLGSNLEGAWHWTGSAIAIPSPTMSPNAKCCGRLRCNLQNPKHPLEFHWIPSEFLRYSIPQEWNNPIPSNTLSKPQINRSKPKCRFGGIDGIEYKVSTVLWYIYICINIHIIYLYIYLCIKVQLKVNIKVNNSW